MKRYYDEKGNSEALTGSKNLLINGDFSTWQRGVGPFVGSQYSADRWNSSDGGTTLSQTTDPSALPDGALFALNVDGGSKVCVASIELPATGEAGVFYIGQVITFSCYIKGSGSDDIVVTPLFRESPNSGANQIIAATGQTFAVDATLRRYTATYTINAVPVGTNICFVLSISNTGGSLTSYTIANAQLEIGSVATDIEVMLAGETLALCQRYYQKSYRQPTDIGTALTTNAVSFINGPDSTGAVGQVSVDLLVTMRGIPTVNIYSADLGTIGLIDLVQADGGIPSHPSGSASQIGDSRFRLVFTSNISSGVRFHYTADAEL